MDYLTVDPSEHYPIHYRKEDPMKIAILGPGCAKCKKLYENAQKAVAEAGVEAELEKVEDIQKINEYNVFMTPALVIDGTVKSTGKLVSPEKIREWLEGV
jgi:small redox-active disulfide protein 2